LSRPSLTNDVRVVVENVIQDPTVAYSVSGTTLTFTSAPPSGTDNIYVVHLGPAVQTTVPPGEISAATTFASNVTVQGAFTSRGIDDNATSTAMTLDTSGNLLVGKTTHQSTLRAFCLILTSHICPLQMMCLLRLIESQAMAILLNFRKDGTTVGSIGSAGSGVRSYYAGNNVGFSPYNGIITLQLTAVARQLIILILVQAPTASKTSTSQAVSTSAALGRLICWTTMRRGLGRL
jgi:hypothetical protein